MYQFFYNVSDEDSIKFLQQLTFVSDKEINYLQEKVIAHPERRESQKKLALTVTSMVHGSKVTKALNSSQILFNLDYVALKLADNAQIDSMFADISKIQLSREMLSQPVLNILSAAKIRETNSDIKRLVKMGGVIANGQLVSMEKVLAIEDLLGGKYIVVKSGKKNISLIELI